MAVPPLPGVVQGPRELYRAPDPAGIFELVDRLGEGSYGAVYKVRPIRSEAPRAPVLEADRSRRGRARARAPVLSSCRTRQGRHIRTGEVVAIKVITLVDEEINEIYGEINILRMLKHANVVKYFGIYLRRGKLWVRRRPPSRRPEHRCAQPAPAPRGAPY